LSEYQDALAAFEKAVAAIDRSPSLYGVTAPDQVYYGAAVAAVMLGDRAKAIEYYRRFAELVESLRSLPWMSDHLKPQDEGLSWLKARLEGPHSKNIDHA
jgi:tetratricopeptide (TPR) repeat protein